MGRMMNNIIDITMFGNFQMRGPQGFLSEEIIHSEKISKLLIYLLYNHKKKVTVQELSDVLWGDTDGKDQAGALKNLMYRLRGMLKDKIGEDNYILSGRGIYFWNPEIELRMDSEEFERFYREGNQAEGQEQLDLFEKALNLYSGKLLTNLESEHWVIAPSTYYHSRYMSMVKKAALILHKEGQYAQMQAICEKAISMDSLEEELHYLLIISLKEQRLTKLALEHYAKAVDILYENLGIRPSGKLQEIYEDLLKETNEKELDLSTIQRDLLEATKPEGVFICEYGIFREIYRLQARQAQRYGMSVYVSLITLETPIDIKPDNDAYLGVLKAGMDHLCESLHCLRAGDVASKYSGAQYVILLPTCTYETGKMVMERIMSKFFSKSHWSRYSIRYSLDEISMAEFMG